MRKFITTAAFVAAFFTAQTQSIKFVTDCQIQPKTIVLNETDGYGIEVKRVNIVGSYCPAQEFPKFKLMQGNYGAEGLPIRDGEVWWLTVTEGIKVVKKERLTKSGFWTIAKPNTTILITVAYEPVFTEK